ncbi:MAG: NAD-dependent epimerase/dehydratase family protein [Proteobacteria bacterium]|nr:NAD-dependent epimerase/dehydratase family protein [Pseudomonadota bacterium]
MRCVITGVAGFVGSSLADLLLSLGYEVTGIDCFIDYYPKELKLKNLESALQNKNFKFHEANLLDLDLVDVLQGADYIFHQAAQAGVRASWGKDFEIYTNNNILASQVLLEACRNPKVKENLKKVVYASSSSVYGDAESLPTTENMLPCPLSPYGVSKLAAEHLMVLYTKEFGVPTASLRYFTVYGPRQRPDMGFNRFIKATLTNQPIKVFGDGEQSRDFTFISDAINANLLAATNPTPELVYNVGGGSRVTVNQVLNMIKEITGKTPNVAYENRQYGDVKHTAADTSRARNAFKYAPKVDLKTGLTHEANWLESLLTKQ